MYNGSEQKQPVTITTKDGEKLAEGTDFTLTYSDDVTNAGKVTVTIKGKGNYTGTVKKTYEITKRTVILTSGSATRNYNGQPLRNTEVTVSGDGLVPGESFIYSGFASRTQPGSTTNTFEVRAGEGTLLDNYVLYQVPGTLTVTNRTIPVIPPVTPVVPVVPGGPVAPGNVLTVIDDFETPLGVGGVYNSMGISFE